LATLKPTTTTKTIELQQPASPYKYLPYVATALVFIVALGIYLLTLEPGLTWLNGGDDGGDLATAAKLLGIPHPTGYPLYLLLAQPLIWFDASPAHALNLMSALWGALTCALLTLSIGQLLESAFTQEKEQEKSLIVNQSSEKTKKAEAKKLTPPPTLNLTTDNIRQIKLASWSGASAAGLILAGSPLFWSQAIIAEVYTLGTAGLALTLWALVRWYRLQQKKELAKENSNITAGLGLVLVAASFTAAHHRTGFLTLLAIGAFIVSGLGGWPKTLAFIKKLEFKHYLVALGLSLSGFLPYLYILVRGGQVPAINWLNPSWANLGGFWDEFNASFYHNLLLAAPASQTLNQLAAIPQLLLTQLGMLSVALALAGWWATTNIISLKPFFWFALVGIVVHSLFAAIYAADNSQMYLLPAFVIWATLAGLGSAYTVERLWPFIVSVPLKVWLASACVVFLVAPHFVTSYIELNGSDNNSAETWLSQEILAKTPNGAILLSDEDKYTFGLWYEEYALGKRPDLSIIETRLLERAWYRENLQRLYPNLNLNGQSDSNDFGTGINQLIKNNPKLSFFNVTANGLQQANLK
jgi:hypothetical protein